MEQQFYLTSTDRYEQNNLKKKLITKGNNSLITQYLVYLESLIKLKEDVELLSRSVSIDSNCDHIVYFFYRKQLPEVLIKGTELLYVNGIEAGLIDLMGDLRKENYRNLLLIRDEDLTRDLLFPGHVYEQKNDYGQVYIQESGVAEEIFYDHLRSGYLEKEYIKYRQSDTIRLGEIY